MDKESAAQYAQVISDMATALRAVTSERDDMQQKLASVERRLTAEKIASAMHDKGIHSDIEPEMLADQLEKEAEKGNLPEIQRAVDMVAPNMGVKLAHVSDDPRVGVGTSKLEQFIFGEVG